MIKLFGNRGVGKGDGVPTAPRIYLDYASATPMCAEAVEAMMPFMATHFGNASAVHQEGQVAKQAVSEARAKVAHILGIQKDGVTFTSGGTESNNLAIMGVVENLYRSGTDYSEMEIITTSIEHPATQKTVEALEMRGVCIKYVKVDEDGLIKMSELAQLLTNKTVLCTVSYVNSEIGVIQDIGAIRRVLDKYARSFSTRILLHVDAAQAPLWLPCSLPQLGVDLMSLDAGKFGGPKGVGVLARSKQINFANIAHGGGQENNKRPGTEPVMLLAGLAAALTKAQSEHKAVAESVAQLRDYFWQRLQDEIPTVVLNGARGENRVANNLNISIPGIDSEFAVVILDVAGIACSTKSACSSAGGGESAVVKAISNDAARATSTLRFTLGPNTTTAELDKVVSVLKQHVASIPKFPLY